MRLLIHMSARAGQAILARGLIEAAFASFPEDEIVLEAAPALIPLWADLATVRPYAGTPYLGVERYPEVAPDVIFFNAALQAYEAFVERYGVAPETLLHAFNARMATLGAAHLGLLELPKHPILTAFRERPSVRVPARSVLFDLGRDAAATEAVSILARHYPALIFYTPATSVAPNVVTLQNDDLVRVSAIGDRCAALVVFDPEIALATNTETNRHKERLVAGEASQLRFDPHSRTRALDDVSAIRALLDTIASSASTQGPKVLPVVLFVSHRAKQCGVAEYGRNVSTALSSAAQRYRFVYVECDDERELRAVIAQHRPDAVLYNRNSLTMRWLTPAITRSFTIPQLGIMHEVTQQIADAATTQLFDAHLAQDPTLQRRNPIVWPTERLLPIYHGDVRPPERLRIGSFGFGVPGKGFEALVARVCEEFDEADIRLHIPANDFVDPQGENARQIAQMARTAATKPGVRVMVDHDFFTTEQLLDFLAGNHLNAFFYDAAVLTGNGISSVIDYALAVRRPLAVTPSGMFRTVFSANPPILVDRTSLREIIANGTAPLEQFYERWSPARFVADYERILDEVFDARRRVAAPHPVNVASQPASQGTPKKAPPFDCAPSRPIVSSAWAGHAAGNGVKPIRLDLGVPGVQTFNRILDDATRGLYADAIARLHVLCPQTIARKIPEANVQQAFVFDTVRKLAASFKSPRILCVGSFEDTAAEALKAEGYAIEEIDPEINYDLDTFCSLSSTRTESYDIVFSTSVLEHVRDDVTFVRKMGELIAPGGFGVMTVDYHDGYYPGMSIPPVDHRWYTQRDFHARLFPALPGSRLLGAPQWDCASPDFFMAGWNYTFATFCWEKIASSIVVR